jgi:serpin B
MAKGLARKRLSFSAFLALLFSPILIIGCPSATQMQVNTRNISDIVNGNNQFALDMFSKLGGQQQNVFFSPWSIYSAIAMAHEGAKGKTAKEMQQMMHFPENDSQRELSFASAYDKFNEKEAGYMLSTANALWVEKEYPLLNNFASTIERYYHGTAKNVDFKGAPEETRLIINFWVEEKTNNKIKGLISQGSISPQAKLVITNAVYFNGKWVKSFDKNATRKKDFRTGDGRIIETLMMSSVGRESRFYYTETGDIQILELPYEGKRISMIILLPKGDNISSLEKSLSLGRLAEWRKGLEEDRVDVYIPKFTLATKYYSMAKNFEDLGMQTAFTPGADFSGINGKNDLFIDEVIHQAFVDVNEQGTEAAGATSIGMKTSAMGAPRTPVFYADHPFVFLIQDIETGNILFMGMVSDPSKN